MNNLIVQKAKEVAFVWVANAHLDAEQVRTKAKEPSRLVDELEQSLDLSGQAVSTAQLLINRVIPKPALNRFTEAGQYESLVDFAVTAGNDYFVLVKAILSGRLVDTKTRWFKDGILFEDYDGYTIPQDGIRIPRADMTTEDYEALLTVKEAAFKRMSDELRERIDSQNRGLYG